MPLFTFDVSILLIPFAFRKATISLAECSPPLLKSVKMACLASGVKNSSSGDVALVGWIREECTGEDNDDDADADCDCDDA